MLFIKMENGKVTDVSEESRHGDGWESRWDWKGFDAVEQLADEVSEVTGELHIPIDKGPHTSPRYDIIKAPKVGDKVSFAFNGDYYPDGEIVNISKTMKVIETSMGNRYHRVKKSGRWMKGGTWTLVQGHIDRRNPHF